MDQMQAEKDAIEQLGTLIASGDDQAANAAEELAAQERALLEKHAAPTEGPAAAARQEQEAELDLADVVAGRSRKPVEDADVQALLQKYGGNVDAALRAAVHAQRLIGEKGSELGQLKKQMEAGQAPGDEEAGEYDDLLYDDQQEYAFESRDAFQDHLYEIMDEDPAQAAELARRSGDRELYDEALENWHAEDPRAAARYERTLELNQRDALRDYQAQQTAIGTAQLNEAYSNVSSRFRDFGELEGKMAEVAQTPEGMAVLAGMSSSSVSAKERSIVALYSLARGDAESAEAALPDVPYVATSQVVPSGRNRKHNALLDGMAEEAEQLSRVSEMFDEGVRAARKR